MRICLITGSAVSKDPRSLATVESLRQVGHDVVVASSEDDDFSWVLNPRRASILSSVLRRSPSERLAYLAAGTHSSLFIPTHPNLIEVADTAAGRHGPSSVLVRPGWPRPTPDHDLIELAPSDLLRSVPSSGLIPALHTRPSYGLPQAKAKGSIVIAYRKTAKNPGRYLEAALARAGLDVRQVEEIDWATIDPNTRAVVVVESPLPALPVRGSNPGVPVVFWVHHGEHHLEANIRLQARYGAHAVLLAHSWHLSFRFHGLVDRLPFAVAPELFSPEFKPHRDRRWDLAFVGATSTDDRYARREDVLRRAIDRLGASRVAVASDISPEEMASLYQDARAVYDDGAGRHLPITMRVFEAVGAGALLLTIPGPGLAQLFTDGDHYLSFDPTQDEVTETLIAGSEAIAERANSLAWERHTYSQRVTELLSVIERIREEGIDAPEPQSPNKGLGGLVDMLPDAQRILALGANLTGQLPDREVWDFPVAEARAEPGTFHLAVLGGGRRTQWTRAIAAARLGVVMPPGLADEIEALVGEIHGEARRYDSSDGTIFTFGSSGYRVSSEPDLG